MMTAGSGLTKPAAGVIATSPATTPLEAPSSVGFPAWFHSANSHVSAAADAAVLVVTNAFAAKALACRALPALNPNHPTQSSAAPVTAKGKLCGAIYSDGKPRRRPITIAHTRAEAPELMCTTVPPAKSSTPSALIHPPLPHTQCANGSYTQVVHSSPNTRKVLNFMRSANAPVINAGVKAANIPWKIIKARWGMVSA